MSYEHLSFQSGRVSWDFNNFVRQAHELLKQVPLGAQPPRVAYLQAQQDLIDADINCAFRSDSQFPAPYLDMTVSHGGRTIRAKAVIYSGNFRGCFWRTSDRTQENFFMPSIEPMIKLLMDELHEPSFNFCTVYGDDLTDLATR